jgi:hypothetical protein
VCDDVAFTPQDPNAIVAPGRCGVIACVAKRSCGSAPPGDCFVVQLESENGNRAA